MSFYDTLAQAWAADELQKISLSKARSTEGLRNVYVRPVQLKKGRQLSFTLRYAQQDITKNYELKEAIEVLKGLLGPVFEQGHLLCAQGVFVGSFDAQGQPLRFQREGKAAAAKAPQAHNRSKQYLCPANRPFLQLLGLASAKGEVFPSQMDKYKQINKFLEIIETLLPKQPKDRPLRVVDMGCGKGYLTFALYDYLQNQGYQAEVCGIELRAGLVEQTNQWAKALGFEGLHFLAQDIAHYAQGQAFDWLIALHACDTATDLALAVGIFHSASTLLVAPCCHKQVRRALAPPAVLQPLLKHGILLERQAELLTDALRALYLESQGYQTKVFEFIGLEHTAKNLMIAAQKQKLKPSRAEEALAEIAALKQTFGLEEHFLGSLLERGIGGDW
jgi:SAM-dependent methyltransferase